MNQTLPYIPRKNIKLNGRVDLWDVLVEEGPAKVEFTTILAREALQRDSERYKLDLPRGTKPGPAQAAAEERLAAEMAETNAEAPDPAYGRTPV